MAREPRTAGVLARAHRRRRRRRQPESWEVDPGRGSPDPAAVRQGGEVRGGGRCGGIGRRGSARGPAWRRRQGAVRRRGGRHGAQLGEPVGRRQPSAGRGGPRMGLAGRRSGRGALATHEATRGGGAGKLDMSVGDSFCPAARGGRRLGFIRKFQGEAHIYR